MRFFADASGPPGVALLFRNMAASAIWKEWRQTFGTDDASDRLRLTIVSKINPDDPFAYRAVVVAALNPAHDGRAKVVFGTARVLEMAPSSDANLRAFKAEFERTHRCLLGYASMPQEGVNHPMRVFETLKLSAVRFVEAKDISDQDLDGVALL